MLLLNKTKVKGSDLKVFATLTLAGEDISGQSSHTDVAEGGDKPKQLGVTLQIKFKDSEELTNLVNLAQTKDDNGDRAIYNIVNDTAKAMNIRRVRFLGDFTAREDETTKLWRVSFKLSEVTSTAEAEEARKPVQPVTDQGPTGEPTVPTDTVTPEIADLSTFEGVLQWVDDKLATDNSDAN